MMLVEGGMKASWGDISWTLAFCSSKLWRTVILLLQLFTDYSHQPLLWGEREERGSCGCNEKYSTISKRTFAW